MKTGKGKKRKRVPVGNLCYEDAEIRETYWLGGLYILLYLTYIAFVYICEYLRL